MLSPGSWEAVAETLPAGFASTSPGYAPRAPSAPFTSFGVTSGFGPRKRPKAGASAFHKGVDYGTPMGTPVTAAIDGVIANLEDPNGYGHYSTVTADDGSRALYGHLGGFSLKNGARVKRGQQIGISGRSGNSTGPHTHFGYYLPDGTPVDPRRYFGGR